MSKQTAEANPEKSKQLRPILSKQKQLQLQFWANKPQ